MSNGRTVDYGDEEVGDGTDTDVARGELNAAFRAGREAKGKFRDPNRAFKDYLSKIQVSYGSPSDKALRKAFLKGLRGRESFDPDAEIEDWWGEGDLPGVTEGMPEEDYQEGRKSGKIK